MRKRTLAIILALLTAVLSACTAKDAAPAATEAEPTPVPTVSLAVAVTPKDYPCLSGIGEAGVIPEQSHHIGIVIGASSPYAANASAFSELGKAYEDAFDMTVTMMQAGDKQQLETIEKMLSNDISFLIIAPGGDEPLGEADTLCAQKGVPYMTIGRRIEAAPGTGSYVCTIEPDSYLNGMLTGIHIAETMKAQYGEPFGNIAEITGVVSDQASILTSRALRRALAPYDRLNVVCSVAGNGDEDTVYQAAANIFKAYREGELDGIVVPDDSAAVTVLQAAADYDRSDIYGKIWSVGATVNGLTGVYYGQLAQTIEAGSQMGLAAMEYALTYLEGGAQIPPIITSLTRVFTAETQGKKDGIAKIIAALDERGAQGGLESVGEYALFLPDDAQLRELYPQRYDTYADSQEYLNAFEPYTTQKALYQAQQSEGEEGAA